MRALVLLFISFTTLQAASAATMARCSVTTKFQDVRGVNLLIQANNKTSAYLFVNGSAAVRLEGSTSVKNKSEMWYYGNDLNRPAGERVVKLVSSSVKAINVDVKTELRFEQASPSKTVSGRMTVNGKTMNLLCDISEE